MQTEQSKKKKIRAFEIFVIGFFMGIADLIPGVSGGTIAFIMGIYKQLIDSIKTVTGTTLKLLLTLKFRESIKSVPFLFLVPLALGILTAIFSLSRLMAWLLNNHSEAVWALFFGLILASVVVIVRKITHWNISYVIALAVTAIAAYIITGLVPVETAFTLPLMFISGAIAITAMILPGISGSFILVILGKYEQLLGAVNQKDILTIFVFMCGAAVGLALFSRLISFLFHSYYNICIAILSGFMLGSLRKIWPWKETLGTHTNDSGDVVSLIQQNVLPDNFMSAIIAILLATIGFLIIIILDRYNVTEEKNEGINTV